MAYSADVRAPGLTARLGAIATNIAARFERRRIYTRTLHELSALSGRELADLGLHRSQLRAIALKAAYDK